MYSNDVLVNSSSEPTTKTYEIEIFGSVWRLHESVFLVLSALCLQLVLSPVQSYQRATLVLTQNSRIKDRITDTQICRYAHYLTTLRTSRNFFFIRHVFWQCAYVTSSERGERSREKSFFLFVFATKFSYSSPPPSWVTLESQQTMQNFHNFFDKKRGKMIVVS